MSFEVTDILKQREAQYGSYSTHSVVKDDILETFSNELPQWHKAHAIQRQAAGMIIDKLIRAFNGDYTYEDNWIDIQGYAKLVSNWLEQRLKSEI